MRVVAVGECTLDRYEPAGVTRVGGISLNFAVHARASGARAVSLVSCTGSDEGGERIPAWLTRHGVSTERLHRLEGGTASQRILLGPGGERSFPAGGYSAGVLRDFRLTEEALIVIRAAELVAVPWFREIRHLAEPVLEDPARRGVLALDLLDGAELGRGFPGIEPLLGRADLLFLSAPPEAVESLAPRVERSGTVVVVTHGAVGSTALLNGHRFMAPAVEVPAEECIDTTGCGDAFQAAFAVSYLRRSDVPAALEAGALRAATVLRHLGATPDEGPS